VLLLPLGAGAARPDARAEARRFGLDVPELPTGDELNRAAAGRRALQRFNSENRGGNAGAMRAAAAGGGTVLPAARQVAETFLLKSREALGIDPGELRLELARTDGGYTHLLFVQVHAGLPVEFSRIKVHVDADGNILSLQNGFRRVGPLDSAPTIPESAAAAAAAADLGIGGPTPRGGRLVFYPRRDTGELALAWKFRLEGAGGRWFYYVDARDGRILFRYDDLRHQVCMASGTVSGEVYEYDPVTWPSPTKVTRPIAHQRVYVGNAATSALTDSAGFFCSATPGKVFSQLQGPYASVANYTVPAAHYDNGAGVWATQGTPVGSAHPYADNSITTATINASAGVCPGGRDPVKVLPVFSAFQVGVLTPEGDISDDDQVEVVDPVSGNAVAAYVGSKGAFRGTAVPGRSLQIRLRTNEAGTQYGYDVGISSYLCLVNAPTVSENTTSTYTWTNLQTYDGTRDEINIFYHINKAHDYFMAGPNSSTSTWISKPIVAMARVGPNLANAFYDPLQQSLYFGDVANGFATDGSVIRHEYVHFVVDQIYPVLNFGQNGAISEALSDYFPASDLAYSAIGKYTSGAFGGEGALRELDYTKPGGSLRVFPTHWAGEVHDDSLILSQALWEIRQPLIGSLGATNGRKCSDRLVFRSLFFYPDSFRDFLEAMLQTSYHASTLAPACGGDNVANGPITAQFSAHGIVESPARDGGDSYEPNDGVQSATDVSTATLLHGRIYPAADLDYYAIAAAPGPMSLTLSLPASPSQPGSYYAYGMTLLDSRFNLLAEALPSIDINPTLSGNCPNDPLNPCLTTSSQVRLTYSAPAAGQYYVMVAAAPADYASNDVTNSTLFYSLSADYSRTGPVDSSVVAASFDNDLVGFRVKVASFVQSQNYGFSYARFRDHALNVVPQTETNGAGVPYLAFVSSSGSMGTITGTLRLVPGFSDRFPAVGSVHLEVFGVNPLGHSQSLGLSPELHLTAQRASFTAWNNVFNPARGEKATLKYESTDAGHVRLRLFTMAGSLVRTLIDEDRPAGKGSVDWDGSNLSGIRVASGIYLLHLEAPGITKIQKVVVVK